MFISPPQLAIKMHFTLISRYTIKGLQLILNSAARLLRHAGRIEHIMQHIAALYWFPVRSRIDFILTDTVLKPLMVNQSATYEKQINFNQA